MKGKIIRIRFLILLNRRHHFPVTVEKRIFNWIPKYLHQILKIRFGAVAQAIFSKRSHGVQGIMIPIIHNVTPRYQVLPKIKSGGIVSSWNATAFLDKGRWNFKK